MRVPHPAALISGGLGLAYYSNSQCALKQRLIDAYKQALESSATSFPTRWYEFSRPLLFKLLGPEEAHRAAINFLAVLGRITSLLPSCKRTESPFLSQSMFGLQFCTPVGIAAGFDKNGEAFSFLSSNCLPLGHLEVGSVSAHPWSGNPKPRLFRIPEASAILNRMGLNNDGADAVSARVTSALSAPNKPFGINIVKTPDENIIEKEALLDFVSSFQKVAPIADWITVNVSCPNTAEGKTFESPEAFAELIKALQNKRKEIGVRTPILVKLSPIRNGAEEEFLSLIRLARDLEVDGLILSNTAGDREFKLPQYVGNLGKGGVSGQPLLERTKRSVALAFQETGGAIPIIAVGGVSCAEDAYELIKAGASLVQLYTSMIYKGPGIFTDINRGLERLLIADGFKNIADARGVASR